MEYNVEYYDKSFDKLMSYNAFLNIIVGTRGVGKTFTIVNFLASEFIKKKKQFVYVRRYKSDFKHASKLQFWSAISQLEKYSKIKFSVNGNMFYINGEIAGYFVTLATSQDLKGSNFDNVSYVFFDEFIIEKGQKKYYLNDEVNVFLGLLETIGRFRNIKIFMVGNASDINNPYFIEFGISLPYNNNYKTFKDGLIVLHYAVNESYVSAKKESNLGRLAEGTSYENFAIDNKFFDENDNIFISKKSNSAVYKFSLIYKGFEFGIWFDYKFGIVYVSQDVQKSCPYSFALTNHDFKPNTMLLNSAKKFSCFRSFIDNYTLGNVRYESKKIQSIFKDVMKMLITGH